MDENLITAKDIKELFNEEEINEIAETILPEINKETSEKEENKIEFTPNEIKILHGINLFNEKISNAYEVRYKEKNIETRSYIGTSEEILLSFFFAYKYSKYYKNDTEEDERINYNIFEQLKNIIFEAYIIFEFEILDENPLFKEKSENDYEMLYNLNKTQNLIIKTRILWEKVMNFFYLLIERKDMKYDKSKKAKFEKWCKEKNINFFDDIMKKLGAFDNEFRTGEVHAYSKLKNYFERGINQNINLYCLDLLFAFSNEVIINIMAYINDIEPKYKMWQKLPKDITEQLEEFTEAPEWVKLYTQNENIYEELEDGGIINNYDEVKGEMFNN